MTWLKNKKNIAKLSVWAGFLFISLFLFVSASLSEEPLQFKIEVTPNTLTGPATVRVSINCINMGDDGTPVSVTLYDPDRQVCTTFGSGGTASLAPGASQSYSGSWTVTAAQLEAGKIIYSARYSTTNELGQPVSANKPISASIKHNQAVANMQVSRSFAPGTTVMEGQTVTVNYELVNTGSIDISDIIIKDPGVLDGQVTYQLLKVGESTNLSYHFVAGNASKTSAAELTYSYLVGSKKETKTRATEPKVITVTVPDVSVKLASSRETVKAGDKVDLLCTITNKSNLSYEQLKVTDLILNDVESGISIGAGKSYEFQRSITVSKTATYQFTVKGIDSTGGSVTFESNSVTIKTSDDPSLAQDPVEAIPLDLDIAIEADREVIYTRPSDIVFRVKVTNFGTTEVKNIVISAASYKSKNIRTIEKLAPQETAEFVQLLSASMEGQYVFRATAKDNTGKDVFKDSNPVQVTFQVTSPPVTAPPPPTIAPTEPPPPPETNPTETVRSPFGNEGEEQQSTGAGVILLYALAGLLIVVLLAVILLFVLDKRRNKAASSSGASTGNIVIDSIQRSPHRDYAKVPKRSTTGNRKETKKKEKEAPNASVYAPDPEEPFENDLSLSMPDDAEAPVAPETYEESIYRRPGSVRSEIKFFDAETDLDASPLEEQSSSSKAYLSRIRSGSSAKLSDEEIATPLEAEPVGTMSEDEAALLSGSTAQYRLSRNISNMRPSALTTPKIEDAESFTRKQRASRSSRSSDLSNFYEDDDDGEGVSKPTRHRRR